jgi:hypothetical protein
VNLLIYSTRYDISSGQLKTEFICLMRWHSDEFNPVDPGRFLCASAPTPAAKQDTVIIDVIGD